MSKDYQRLDALERILEKRSKTQRQSQSDRCRQIVDNWRTEGLTSRVLESIKDLPINQALTEAYKKDKE